MLFVLLFFVFGQSSAKLWPRGVVHYSINSKDYDLHSQDEIVSTLEDIEKEICIKFFAASANYNATNDDPILYITNKDRSKNCPSQIYDFSKPIVDMAVGYKCLSRRAIAKIVVEMLRASVTPLDQKPINSETLLNTFKESEQDKNQRLLSPNDRNYINGHYHNECQSLSANVPVIMRRTDDVLDALQMDEDNKNFYKDLVWPLGVVLYGVDPELANSEDHEKLKFGMTSIETASCVMFEEIPDSEQKLKTKNYLYFTKDGDEVPQLGFKTGAQKINLKTMTDGASGHYSHVTNNLMRALGIPMMSNRFDRDNFINIDWKKVEKGKELFLEKMPQAAWIKSIPYDFESVTHAPINFMCGSRCDLGERTVNPMQDHMWGRVMKMGKTMDLSESDRKSLDVVYGSQCSSRYYKTD